MRLFSTILGLLATSTAAQAMELSADPLIEGDVVSITIDGAPPNAVVVIARSWQAPSPAVFCPPVLQGACLDLVQPTVLIEIQTDANGHGVARPRLPQDLTSRDLWLQAVTRTGSAVSQVVRRRLLQDCTERPVNGGTAGIWYTDRPDALARLLDCGNVSSQIEWRPVNGLLPALPNLVEARSIRAYPGDDTVLDGLPNLKTAIDLYISDGAALQSVQLPAVERILTFGLINLPALAPFDPFPALERVDTLFLEAVPPLAPTWLDGRLEINGAQLVSLPWLTDLSMLGDLTTLTWLWLQDVPLVDLSGLPTSQPEWFELYLEDLPALTSLDGFVPPTGAMSFTLINAPLLTDLSAVSGANSLVDLRIESQPGLTDLSAFEGIPLLAEVTLHDLPDLTTVAHLAPGLASGDLSDVELQLSQLPSLSTLDGLQPMTEAQWLYLVNLPQITDLTPLAALVAVQRDFGISDLPALSSLGGLEGLTAVGGLHLIENLLLADVAALSGVQQVGQLSAWDNPSLCSDDLFTALSNANIGSSSVRDNGTCP